MGEARGWSGANSMGGARGWVDTGAVSLSEPLLENPAVDNSFEIESSHDDLQGAQGERGERVFRANIELK